MKRMAPIDRYARLERLLGHLLLAGAAASTVLLAAGLACWMIGLRGAATSFCFEAGLLVLMATPVARVVVSLLEYARQRDWLFVAATATVLAVLAGTVLTAVRMVGGAR